MTFRLYPEERHFWSMADYGAVLSVVQRLGSKSVLEFGPGASTLALIEGGAEHVDACEDDWSWAQVYRERLEERFPTKIVTIRPYDWADPLRVHGVTLQRYDLALIDGPEETPRRPAVVEYCLQRCAYVLTALECAQGSTLMREACAASARRHARAIEIMETGPLAGAFALIGPAC